MAAPRGSAQIMEDDLQRSIAGVSCFNGFNIPVTFRCDGYTDHSRFVPSSTSGSLAFTVAPNSTFALRITALAGDALQFAYEPCVIEGAATYCPRSRPMSGSSQTSVDPVIAIDPSWPNAGDYRIETLLSNASETYGAQATPRPNNAIDDDGDGATRDVDCNDRTSAAHPGATEVCDDLDDDCDGVLTEDRVLYRSAVNFRDEPIGHDRLLPVARPRRRVPRVGYATGFRHIGHNEDTSLVTCISRPLQAVITLPPTSLAYCRRADGTPRSAFSYGGCYQDVRSACLTAGYEGGFGPLSMAATANVIVCFRG